MARKSGTLPRREEFLDAALKRLSRLGYTATSTRDICSDLGLVHSAIYNYFPSKEAVVLAIEEREMTELQEELDALLDRTGGDSWKRALYAVTFVFRMAATRRSAWRLLAEMVRSISPANKAIVIGRRDRFQKTVTATLEDAARDGHISPRDIHMTTLHLFGMAEGMSGWYKPNGALTRSQVVFEAVQFFMMANQAAPDLVSRLEEDVAAMPRIRKPARSEA